MSAQTANIVKKIGTPGELGASGAATFALKKENGLGPFLLPAAGFFLAVYFN